MSDTHGYIDEAILKYVRQADEVWHAGDIGNLNVTDELARLTTLRAVYGNIDGAETRLQFPEEQVFDSEGVKVYMIHIGGYPGKYRAEVRKRIQEIEPQIYICGHSHILKVQYDAVLKTLYLNPGAAGISGFHQVRTMLRFEIDQGKIQNMEVIEWPKTKKTEL